MSVVDVKGSAVPQYLRGSEFYKSLDLQHDEEVSVPADCFKLDDHIENVDDLQCLLSTVRFWGIEECPETVVNFVLGTNDIENTLSVGSHFESELRYLVLLRELSQCPDSERLAIAIKHDNLAIMKYLVAAGAELDKDAFKSACERNSFNCLKYISHGCNKTWLTESVLRRLITKGYLGVIEHLHSQGYDVILPCAATVACRYGHLQLLKFYLNLRNPVIDCTKLYATAASCNQLACLQYACEQGHLKAGTGREIIINICEFGYLDIIKYVHEQGVGLEEQDMEKAASYGFQPVVQYLHEHGCPWGQHTSWLAARGGYLPCFTYLHQHGCPVSANILSIVVENGHTELARYVLDNQAIGGVSEGMYTAVKFGRVQILQLLHTEYAQPLRIELCALAMQYGRIECLRYLHEHGAEWGDTDTEDAAKNGHYDCIVYAHENGCAWGPHTCDNAITSGHLFCLKYAHKHGCPWNIAIYKDTTVFRHRACIAYVDKQLRKLGPIVTQVTYTASSDAPPTLDGSFISLMS